MISFKQSSNRLSLELKENKHISQGLFIFKTPENASISEGFGSKFKTQVGSGQPFFVWV